MYFIKLLFLFYIGISFNTLMAQNSSNENSTASNQKTQPVQQTQPVQVIIQNTNVNLNPGVQQQQPVKTELKSTFKIVERQKGFGLTYGGLLNGALSGVYEEKEDQIVFGFGGLVKLDYRFYHDATVGLEVAAFVSCKVGDIDCDNLDLFVPITPFIAYDPLIFFLKFGLGPYIHTPLVPKKDSPDLLTSNPISKGFKKDATEAFFGMDTSVGFSFDFNDEVSMPLYANFRFIFSDPVLILAELFVGMTYRINMGKFETTTEKNIKENKETEASKVSKASKETEASKVSKASKENKETEVSKESSK